MGLARHSLPPMTPTQNGAARILAERGRLDFVVDTLAQRVHLAMLQHCRPRKQIMVRSRVRERTPRSAR